MVVMHKPKLSHRAGWMDNREGNKAMTDRESGLPPNAVAVEYPKLTDWRIRRDTGSHVLKVEQSRGDKVIFTLDIPVADLRQLLDETDGPV
jgi:hypothetical protein